MKKLLPLFLCVCLLAGTLSGCGGKRDLMQGVTPAVVSDIAAPADGAGVASGLSLRLLRQEMEDGENVLLSPLSILCALSMTANGARGETLAQMEQVLGMPVESLNAYRWPAERPSPTKKSAGSPWPIPFGSGTTTPLRWRRIFCKPTPPGMRRTSISCPLTAPPARPSTTG